MKPTQSTQSAQSAQLLLTAANDDDPLLFNRDVAEMTGLTESTVRYYASSNTGPVSFKLGRRRVYRRSAVLAWIAAAENEKV